MFGLAGQTDILQNAVGLEELLEPSLCRLSSRCGEYQFVVGNCGHRWPVDGDEFKECVCDLSLVDAALVLMPMR